MVKCVQYGSSSLCCLPMQQCGATEVRLAAARLQVDMAAFTECDVVDDWLCCTLFKCCLRRQNTLVCHWPWYSILQYDGSTTVSYTGMMEFD